MKEEIFEAKLKSIYALLKDGSGPDRGDISASDTVVDDSVLKEIVLPPRGGSVPSAPKMKNPIIAAQTPVRDATVQTPQMKRYIYPAPGIYGMKAKLSSPAHSTLVTVYCPVTFEIFQVRTNEIMSIADFKAKIAQKYGTSTDNIVISYGEKEFKGGTPFLITNGNNNRTQYSSMMSRVIHKTTNEEN